jgi:hypothetical protein
MHLWGSRQGSSSARHAAARLEVARRSSPCDDFGRLRNRVGEVERSRLVRELGLGVVRRIRVSHVTVHRRVLKITPPLLLVTVIVIVTLLPLLMVPRSQLTMRLASLQVPAVGVAETNVLRWRVCVIDTEGALPGPAFETTVV